MESNIQNFNSIDKMESSDKNKSNINFKHSENLIYSYTSLGGYSNSFCIFNSIDNILSLIYTDNFFSIIYYNIIDNKIINIIKKAHSKYISNFIHYLDNKNKRDLIISISCEDNHLKLWNINDLICLIDIKKLYDKGYLFSACFLIVNKKIYILVSNCNWNETPNSIRVYDLKGNIVNVINDSADLNLFIDSYYDKRWSKNYIIT